MTIIVESGVSFLSPFEERVDCRLEMLSLDTKIHPPQFGANTSYHNKSYEL